MKSKLTIPVFTLTIIFFWIITIANILPIENILFNLPRAMQSILIGMYFTIVIIALLGSFVMPIFSTIAIYKTYKNKLDGKALAITSFIISLINLAITLTIVARPRGGLML